MPITPNNSRTVRIFIDLDGVLADFDLHLRQEGKRAPDGKPNWDELDYAWWSTIPLCVGAKNFYDEACKMGATKFLTAPVLDEECFSGKARWVQDFVPERGKDILKDLIVCPSTDKYLLAKPGHILVDDRESNIKDWVAAGGIGIHHKGDFTETLQKLKDAVAAISAPAAKPARKPRLITIGGMSGSGKTALGEALLKKMPHAVHLDADRTRKAIFGVAETDLLPQEAYSAEATARLIFEMDRRAAKALAEGKDVIVTAATISDDTRARQKVFAEENGARFVGIWLQADLDVLFDRVVKRVNNVSNAGVDIVKKQQKFATLPKGWAVIDANQPQDAVAEEALKAIQAADKAMPAQNSIPKKTL